VAALVMRLPMSSRELAGVLVRSGLQGVTLPEAPSGAVKPRETVPVAAGSRFHVAEPAPIGPRALHAAAVRKVRHG